MYELMISAVYVALRDHAQNTIWSAAGAVLEMFKSDVLKDFDKKT